MLKSSSLSKLSGCWAVFSIYAQSGERHHLFVEAYYLREMFAFMGTFLRLVTVCYAIVSSLCIVRRYTEVVSGGSWERGVKSLGMVA